MADTSAARLSRLLALVPWLVVNDGVTVEQAAAHFGVTPQQLEKDLFLLIVSGLPGHGPDQLVDIHFWDAGSRIHVLDPQTIDRPLRLSGEEATALLVALRLLAQVPGDHDRDALNAVTLRLEAALGGPATVEIQADADPSILAAVSEAIAVGCPLRIVYGSGTSDAITERVIEPIAVESVDGRTTVEAFCRLAGARRTFRVDRIHAAEVLGADQPTPAAGEDTRTSSEPLAVRVAIDAAADWAAESLSLQEPVPAPDGRLVGRAEVHDVDWLVRTVLGLGGVAEVLEPAAVRAAVAVAARDALAAYAGASRSKE